MGDASAAILGERKSKRPFYQVPMADWFQYSVIDVPNPIAVPEVTITWRTCATEGDFNHWTKARVGVFLPLSKHMLTLTYNPWMMRVNVHWAVNTIE